MIVIEGPDVPALRSEDPTALSLASASAPGPRGVYQTSAARERVDAVGGRS
jgi:hypothetical protein